MSFFKDQFPFELNDAETLLSLDDDNIDDDYLDFGGVSSDSERECIAVKALLEEHERLKNDGHHDFIEFDLDHFAVYIDPPTHDGKSKKYPSEMRPLHHLSTRVGCNRMWFDGVLSLGEKRFFVRHVPFEELPIGNYGITEPTVGSEMWLRSSTNAKCAQEGGHDVYYRLKTPSQEYRRYHSGFLWIADLAKHVTDYLSWALDMNRLVVLRDFRFVFSNWLATVHGQSKMFVQWREQYTSTNFGTAIVANVEFIYKEACGVLGQDVSSIRLWEEIRDLTAYSGEPGRQTSSATISAVSSPSKSPASSRQDSTPMPVTIVTPYIEHLFSHLPCGMMLKALSPSATTETLRRSISVNKDPAKQGKNQSLVAAFASFIDVYRPKYGLLENVMEIIQPKGKRGEDMFSQLICAIVGLGYQARVFLLDAWNYGSPQSRSRVFLCFAAPGMRLPEMPLHSHSHYKPRMPSKNLGFLRNGEHMVKRLVMPTPFKFVSAADATSDLPDIMDGKADSCINFPDHRLAFGITRRIRTQLNIIPMRPYCMDFRKAWKDGHGIMTASERDFFPIESRRVKPGSKAWGRTAPNKVFPTITTTPAPTDARVGRLMHWSQNRILSVMEARRAQGLRDHEVILGKPADQWKIIGNSVAREVSLVLGLSLREAWLGSLVDGDEVAPNCLPPRPPNTATSEAQARSGTAPAKRPLSRSSAVDQFGSKSTKTRKAQTANGRSRKSRSGHEILHASLKAGSVALN
ncbi:DNA (cytosine-5)-methyltransferase 1A [Colletotrichum chlorophyti]|uniref:DNA (cytosine-5-)-methyltransferase n=1 Tax=Colletotrichum chlorophyti TaxID=708187 RepID=A0A1Q8S0R1_9PEZI|nr:DNA (cytosine-5)-methyltransferase 1A [Colletotrichum chlorophyti]